MSLISWDDFRERFRRLTGVDSRSLQSLSMLVPTKLRGHSPETQLLGAAATASALMLAMTSGAAALGVVIAALLAIYVIFTRLLGLSIRIDPTKLP